MEKTNKTGPFTPDPKNTHSKSGVLAKDALRAKAESKASQATRVTRHFQNGAVNTVQGHQAVNGRKGQNPKGGGSNK